MTKQTRLRDNVDSAEVAKFNALAARWWDPEGDFRPLHQINPLRLDWIRQHAEIAGRRFVDIGCGGGILAEAMSKPEPRSPGSIWPRRRSTSRVCTRSNRASRLTYEATTAEELAERAPDPSTSSPASRCSNTCPRPPMSFAPVQGTRETGRRRVLLDDQPQSEVVPVRDRRAPSTF